MFVFSAQSRLLLFAVQFLELLFQKLFLQQHQCAKKFCFESIFRCLYRLASEAGKVSLIRLVAPMLENTATVEVGVCVEQFKQFDQNIYTGFLECQKVARLCHLLRELRVVE